MKNLRVLVRNVDLQTLLGEGSGTFRDSGGEEAPLIEPLTAPLDTDTDTDTDTNTNTDIGIFLLIIMNTDIVFDIDIEINIWIDIDI